MRLLTGPAGSGKTTILLNQFRDALRAGGEGVRLLTPTATLAQHLQNEVAREGLVFHRNLIQTLNAFVEESAGGVRLAEQPVLYLLVEQAARRLRRPEFARVVDTAGFCAALARTIEEFASAGCDSARLAECLPDTPLGAAFLEVYAEVDRELEARGLELRGRRLERVAARMEREGTGGIRTVWLDGVHALPGPGLPGVWGVGAGCGRHAGVDGGRSDAGVAEAARGHGIRRGARAAKATRGGAGGSEGVGDGAGSGGNRAAHPGAGGGGPAVPRDGNHRARDGDVRADPAVDAGALRNSGAVLLRMLAPPS